MAVIIEMPKLSDTMTVGTVVKWHKQVGDQVANGDVLAEVETDKATMELENFDDGYLLKIFVQEGEEVPIGSALAAVGEDGEDVEDASPAETAQVDQVETAETEEGQPIRLEQEQPVEKTGESEQVEQSAPPLPEDTDAGERILASPLAKKMALEKNLDLTKIKGSGPSGRITKKDVLAQADANVPAKESPALPQPDTNPDASPVASGVPTRTQAPPSGLLKEQIVPVSKMRSIIAQRLLESKSTIPHFYLQKEIDSQPLRLAREAMNERLAGRSSSEEKPLKLTLNDLILKACAETIKWIPDINTSWEGEQIRHHGNVHLAFGVAVEDGLVTPVIRNAESLDLTALSLEAKSLIDKARSKKLTPDEMTGSTFTVTNLGMFGIDFFSGIINPPNAAILSIGASVKKPVVDSSGNLRAGETMTLGLSCDHRLVDGAVGASFLKHLGETLERPASLLV